MLIRNVIPPPPIWFRLPPGYHTLDLARLNELEHVAEALLTPILASSSAVTDSLRDASALVMLLQAIHEGGGIHTSIGVHPDGQDGAAVSLFSLSVRGIESRTPGLAVAQSGLAIANSPHWSSNTRKLLELPIGMSAALVAGTLSAPPRQLLAEAGISAEPSEVFQARLTVSYPSGTRIAVADLTSAATRHGEAYTEILEAIARTITFSAPDSATSTAQRSSRILEVPS